MTDAINWHKDGTPGPYRIEPGANSHVFNGRLMAGDECIAFVECDVDQSDCDYDAPFHPSVNARMLAEGPAMVMALRELADDLESELRDKYPPEMVAQYPVIKRRFDRDMASVAKARAILARIDGDAGHEQREEQQP